MTSIHFIGVSGIGGSAVAKISIKSGIRVSGSADEENERILELVSLGAVFYLGHRREHVKDPDIVVRSAAVPDDNPEVLEAQKKQIPVYYYSDYLGKLMAGKKGIGIAGTHGKTTTTAMTGVILGKSGIFPTIVCGGVMKDYSSNATAGTGEYFVAEACEYNRSFLSLEKRDAVVTNIETDHLDTYKDIDDIKSAFAMFLRTIRKEGFAVVNGDDQNVMAAVRDSGYDRVLTVGKNDRNDYRMVSLEAANGFYSFSIENRGAEAACLKLPVPGNYNCINASLSAVLCLNLGLSREAVEKGIGAFSGIERRLDLLGTVHGDPVYSDYAHHPTEISASIGTLRQIYPSKRLIVVFQPHQYSRTLFLFEEFVEALGGADTLILTEVYRQRDDERYARSVSSKKLYDAIAGRKKCAAVNIEDKSDIVPYLKKHRPENAVVVFMGAGDIDGVARGYMV